MALVFFGDLAETNQDLETENATLRERINDLETRLMALERNREIFRPIQPSLGKRDCP